MKKLVLLVSSVILLWSCNDKPTLQKYFVKNTESSKFIAIDLAPNIIKTDKVAMSETEKAALESFDKMNVIAFKSDSTDVTGYETEIKEVKAILKEETYQQLMKFGSGNDGAAIYFVGNDDEHIEEFVVLAGKKENGFAVVRVLGNDMNPTHIMNMLNLLQKSNLDLEQLKPLQQLMK
ncbi:MULTISPECIES: DUF4252 domain-containing protein [unclassified Flavobacterium]|uniref:DUF4252 domain-containing protein n=1 Tax=unclassified Flavobacterium TaxID=196869 RepID=UPI00129177CA|nr:MULTISPECIES: DUF4252 domain-containing protein [unclassified Flavobacterium]MQP52482.1 DUF4252 domain-containing protein [Flavobacterium sp. LMO9]MQP62552.1 DUF4252 domain-containing protein [Flavobacterium sp. LMO6]